MKFRSLKNNKKNEIVKAEPECLAAYLENEHQEKCEMYGNYMQAPQQMQNYPAAGGYGSYPVNYPAMQAPQYPAQQNGGLPYGHAIDEYGRVYQNSLSFGPLPHSAPVPIPTPSQYIQLAPITVPVAFVPYTSQEQNIYQKPDPNKRPDANQRPGKNKR
jgi:hypothetical protein